MIDLNVGILFLFGSTPFKLDIEAVKSRSVFKGMSSSSVAHFSQAKRHILRSAPAFPQVTGLISFGNPNRGSANAEGNHKV